MKKKVLLSIIVPLLMASIVGCSKEQKEKPHLTYGSETQASLSTLKELSNTELLVKTRDEKEVFLLAVHQGEYSEDCLCWATFKDVIVNYMNLNNRLVYVYNAQNQDDTLKNLHIEKIEQSMSILTMAKWTIYTLSIFAAVLRIIIRAIAESESNRS